MKIYKIAQPTVTTDQISDTTQTQQINQNEGQEFLGTLTPKMKTMLMNAFRGTGLSKQKTLPFLDKLFTDFGDLPLSRVKNMMSELKEDQIEDQVEQQLNIENQDIAVEEVQIDVAPENAHPTV